MREEALPDRAPLGQKTQFSPSTGKNTHFTHWPFVVALRLPRLSLSNTIFLASVIGITDNRAGISDPIHGFSRIVSQHSVTLEKRPRTSYGAFLNFVNFKSDIFTLKASTYSNR